MDIYQRAESLYRRHGTHGAHGNTETAEQAIDLLLQNALTNKADPKAWFELAGCLDYLGREAEALPHYERAFAAGLERLPASDQPRLFLQWGSALRNLGRFEDSEAVLMKGARRFPEMKAMKAFLALTQYTRGNFRGAAQALFVLLHSKHPEDASLAEHARTLDWYIDHLDSNHE